MLLQALPETWCSVLSAEAVFGDVGIGRKKESCANRESRPIGFVQHSTTPYMAATMWLFLDAARDEQALGVPRLNRLDP